MRGVTEYTGPIEIGMDFSYWYPGEDIGKLYYYLWDNNNNTTGEQFIKGYTVVDYRWGEVFELENSQADIPILEDEWAMAVIEYDLIPHENEIEEDLLQNVPNPFTDKTQLYVHK